MGDAASSLILVITLFLYLEEMNIEPLKYSFSEIVQCVYCKYLKNHNSWTSSEPMSKVALKNIVSLLDHAQIRFRFEIGQCDKNFHSRSDEMEALLQKDKYFSSELWLIRCSHAIRKWLKRARKQVRIITYMQYNRCRDLYTSSSSPTSLPANFCVVLLRPTRPGLSVPYGAFRPRSVRFSE